MILIVLYIVNFKGLGKFSVWNGDDIDEYVFIFDLVNVDFSN